MNQGKVVIGICPAYDEGAKVPSMRGGYLLRRTYTRVLAAVGAVPIILNVDMTPHEATQLCDGIVISGGEDVPPKLYHAQPFGRPEEPMVRVAWELQLIEACMSAAVPLLGICYGMQLLAVAQGGRLYQDIAHEIPHPIQHYDPKHNRSMKHKVTFYEDMLGFCAGDTPWVASRHHQAVAQLPTGFRAVATASDGVVEAMVGENCFGLQWHPESDKTGAAVYRAFVRHCATKQQV